MKAIIQTLVTLVVGLGFGVTQAQTITITGTIDELRIGQYVSETNNNVYGNVYLTAPTGLDSSCNNPYLGESLLIPDTEEYERFNTLIATLLSSQVSGQQVTFEYTVELLYPLGFICDLKSVDVVGA